MLLYCLTFQCSSCPVWTVHIPWHIGKAQAVRFLVCALPSLALGQCLLSILSMHCLREQMRDMRQCLMLWLLQSAVALGFGQESQNKLTLPVFRAERRLCLCSYIGWSTVPITVTFQSYTDTFWFQTANIRTWQSHWFVELGQDESRQLLVAGTKLVSPLTTSLQDLV